MNRYIRATICIVLGNLKCGVLKLERRKNVEFGFINLISPNTEITVDKGGKLIWGKVLKMRSGSKVRVRKNAEIIIGDNFSMSNRCILASHELIRIGNDVQFGPGVLVYDHDHDFRVEGGLKANKYKTAPVIIGNNVWIGANTIILRGTKIGDDCVIGAGSILKGEYMSNSVVVQKRL